MAKRPTAREAIKWFLLYLCVAGGIILTVTAFHSCAHYVVGPRYGCALIGL